MAKSRGKNSGSKKTLIIAFALSLLGALTYTGFKYFVPKPINVFEVSTLTQFVYGKNTFSGMLQKDAPSDQPGSYFLTLPDLRIILLDVDGVDFLLGENVQVEGDLLPSVPISNPPKMIVSKIIVSQ